MSKRILIAIVALSLLIGGAVSFFHSKEFGIKKNDPSGDINLSGKDIKGANDFTMDEGGNTFIAFGNCIKKISSSGNSRQVYKDDLEIYAIEYDDGNIYAYIGNSVKKINLSTNEVTSLIKAMPNVGDYKKGDITIDKSFIYVSIGANTNSGVVGDDNAWTNDFPTGFDVPSYGLQLSNNKFNNTYAFSSIDDKEAGGSKLKGNELANASIVKIDKKSLKVSTHAFGIRNTKGIAFDKSGNMYSAIGGMEDRGSRPVTNDSDYVYKIEKGGWYGFPDFSGGDPLNSTRFNIPMALDSPPSMNPPSPLYAKESVASISGLTILNETIFIIDNKEKTLESLTQNGSRTGKLEFPSEFNLKKIKAFGDKLYILENNKGMIFKYELEAQNINHTLAIWLTLSGILISIILILFILKRSFGASL